MFDNKVVEKINDFLKKNINIIFEFPFNGLLLFGGDSIKGFVIGEEIKDYKFYLHTFEKENIKDFFKKNKLNYEKISENEYQFIYNKIQFTIISINDLIYTREFNTDLLFYDVHRKQLISFGIKHALKKRQIIIYNYKIIKKIKGSNYLSKKIETAKKFTRYMNRNNKIIWVKKK